MKVIVLGAGVIGTTTAYYLARSGAQVTVIDRQSGVAHETSFANAGQVSPGYSTPWAAPGIPLKAVRWLLQRHAPLAVRADGSLFQLRWLAKLLHQCTASRYAINKERLMRLSHYSLQCLQSLRQATGISYDEGTGGTLQLFRTRKQLDTAERDLAVLRECGIRHELLDRAGVLLAEPGLGQASVDLAGGLRLPGDETGDCRLFTERLADEARMLGVRFRMDTRISELAFDGDGVSGVRVGGDWMAADRYVIALGSFSRPLLRRLGWDLPVYPVKGYSLTAELADPAVGPRSTVLDETYKVALTRLGTRLRVGGMAELAGFDLALRPRRRATLEKVATELFGDIDLAGASFWAGLRPMTPDGTPVVGATPVANLYLNTGHGTLGWTMACGSGQLLVDLITGQAPAIRHDDLGIT
ncbi:MAG: D-amino acid dehydrogenase, partial [Burkholderiaceae bacterium]|nr:D-amino acid dehydrogenase [Burkholderiaceae bacterium]